MLTKQQAKNLKVVLSKVRSDTPLTTNDTVDVIDESIKVMRSHERSFAASALRPAAFFQPKIRFS